jgi:hypothetical protein
MNSAVLLRASVALALMTGALAAPADDDPTDPAAPVAADRFRSSFSDYRPYARAARPAWHDILQEVAPRNGARDGHGGHASHAGNGARGQHEAPDKSEAHEGHESHDEHPPAEAPATTPAPPDHSQHERH